LGRKRNENLSSAIQLRVCRLKERKMCFVSVCVSSVSGIRRLPYHFIFPAQMCVLGRVGSHKISLPAGFAIFILVNTCGLFSNTKKTNEDELGFLLEFEIGSSPLA
jgi:hypothetical protein